MRYQGGADLRHAREWLAWKTKGIKRQLPTADAAKKARLEKDLRSIGVLFSLVKQASVERQTEAANVSALAPTSQEISPVENKIEEGT